MKDREQEIMETVESLSDKSEDELMEELKKQSSESGVDEKAVSDFKEIITPMLNEKQQERLDEIIKFMLGGDNGEEK